MNSRFIRFIASIVCMLSVFVVSASAQNAATVVDEFDIIVEGELLPDNTRMLSVGNVWLVPLRYVISHLGDADICLRRSGEELRFLYEGEYKLNVGKDTAYTPDGVQKLDAVVMEYDGIEFVSLDFFEKLFGCKVLWDEWYGRVYISDAEEYEKIYRLLKNAFVCNPGKDEKIGYDYNSFINIRDSENEYLIDSTGIFGNAVYDFTNELCTDKGYTVYYGSRIGFEHRAEKKTLYSTKLGEMQKYTDSKTLEAFRSNMLGNAFIERTSGGITAVTIASDSSSDGTSATPLQKLSMVLKLTDFGEDRLCISGSVLGVQSTLRERGVKEMYSAYTIHRNSGRLMSAESRVVTKKVMHGVDVDYITGWKCDYSIKRSK